MADEDIYDIAEMLAEQEICCKQSFCKERKEAGECCECEEFIELRNKYFFEIKGNGMKKATERMIEFARDIAEELCLMDELDEILDSEDSFDDISDFIDVYKNEYYKSIK